MSSLGFSGVLGVTVRTCTSKNEAEGTRRVCAEGGGVWHTVLLWIIHDK